MKNFIASWAKIQGLTGVFCLFFALFFTSSFVSSLSFGEENFNDSIEEIIEEGEKIKKAAEDRKQEKLARIEKEYNDYISRVEERYADQITEKQKKISILQQDLEEGFLDFDAQKNISQSSAQKIIDANSSSKTLKQEIENFNEDIRNIEKRIAIMTDRIDLKEDKISLLSGEKSNALKAKDLQEEMILDYFHLYQVADEEFQEGKEFQKSLELIFTKTSAAQNIQEMAGLQEIEKQSRKMFYLLESTTTRIYEAKKIIQQENQKIIDLKDRLENDRLSLREKKFAKRELLLQTENSEIKYQKLLKRSLQQMHQASQDVQAIQEKTVALQKELKNLERRKRFEEKILTKERIREKMLEELVDQNKSLSVAELGKLFAFESTEFAPLKWPVDPKKGISAYFHDEKYKKRFKQAHDAIDIPTPQGTKIKAATAGYVYKAVDNGKGFSYVVLLHRDNIRTMYGHVSKILVKEGQMIQEGEVIALSGGKPGTNGAGTLTTGPHLHFQVTEGSTPRNPLEYLSLSALD